MDHDQQIAVPLGICTAMTAEVVGACVLTGILDLVNQCIDTVRLSGIIECGVRSEEVEKKNVSGCG